MEKTSQPPIGLTPYCTAMRWLNSKNYRISRCIAVLHRRARDFGGISYHQIDEFMDDYKILTYHKNEEENL